jgi:hypothetical protein
VQHQFVRSVRRRRRVPADRDRERSAAVRRFADRAAHDRVAAVRADHDRRRVLVDANDPYGILRHRGHALDAELGAGADGGPQHPRVELRARHDPPR